MKRLIYTLAIVTLAFQGCSSDEESNNNSSTSGFTWKENGGAEIKADSAYYESAYKTIKAFKNFGDAANKKFIEINLTAGTTGNYDVSNGNAISFLNGNNLYVAMVGMITITESAAAKMSGNFTSSTNAGATTSLEGTFKSIEIR